MPDAGSLVQGASKYKHCTDVQSHLHLLRGTLSPFVQLDLYNLFYAVEHLRMKQRRPRCLTKAAKACNGCCVSTSNRSKTLAHSDISSSYHAPERPCSAAAAFSKTPAASVKQLRAAPWTSHGYSRGMQEHADRSKARSMAWLGAWFKLRVVTLEKND